MSVGHRMWRSSYVFIWFASMEEVENVIRLSNGMYVYEWSIVAKEATFGWDKEGELGGIM